MPISIGKNMYDELHLMANNDKNCTNFSQFVCLLLKDGMKYRQLSDTEKSQSLSLVEEFKSQVDDVFLQYSAGEIDDFILFLDKKHTLLKNTHGYRWVSKESRIRLQALEKKEQEKIAYLREQSTKRASNDP